MIFANLCKVCMVIISDSLLVGCFSIFYKKKLILNQIGFVYITQFVQIKITFFLLIMLISYSFCQKERIQKYGIYGIVWNKIKFFYKQMYNQELNSLEQPNFQRYQQISGSKWHTS
ncbi:hypothetical protein pb186bvf_016086 [Paramecium bursaria]